MEIRSRAGSRDTFPKGKLTNFRNHSRLGGEDVNVYGGGTIDGDGHVWYDLYPVNIYILRPVLFGTIGLQGGTISNLNLV